MLIYKWMIMLEPFGNFISAIAGGLVVLIYWRSLNSWFTLREKRAKKKKKRIKKLKQNLDDEKSKKTKNKPPLELSKFVVAKGIRIFALFIGLGLLVLLGIQAIKYFEKDLWESRNGIVQSIDKSKNGLFFRTKRDPINQICIDRKQAQKLNQEQVQKLNQEQVQEMIDENENCIQQWEREMAISKRESFCQLKAYLESEKESKEYTYDDVNRIMITKLSYMVCMQEEGWFTEACSKEDADCKELMYSESTCTSFTRDWLENGGNDVLIMQCLKSK